MIGCIEEGKALIRHILRTGLLGMLLALAGSLWAEQEPGSPEQAPRAEAQSEIEKGPVISQFRENWILGELRALRQDMMEYRNQMNLLVTDRELEVADKDTTAQLDRLFAAVEAQCKRTTSTKENSVRSR